MTAPWPLLGFDSRTGEARRWQSLALGLAWVVSRDHGALDVDVCLDAPLPVAQWLAARLAADMSEEGLVTWLIGMETPQAINLLLADRAMLTTQQVATGRGLNDSDWLQLSEGMSRLDAWPLFISTPTADRARDGLGYLTREMTVPPSVVVAPPKQSHRRRIAAAVRETGAATTTIRVGSAGARRGHEPVLGRRVNRRPDASRPTLELSTRRNARQLVIEIPDVL